MARGRGSSLTRTLSYIPGLQQVSSINLHLSWNHKNKELFQPLHGPYSFKKMSERTTCRTWWRPAINIIFQLTADCSFTEASSEKPVCGAMVSNSKTHPWTVSVHFWRTVMQVCSWFIPVLPPNLGTLRKIFWLSAAIRMAIFSSFSKLITSGRSPESQKQVGFQEGGSGSYFLLRVFPWWSSCFIVLKFLSVIFSFSPSTFARAVKRSLAVHLEMLSHFPASVTGRSMTCGFLFLLFSNLPSLSVNLVSVFSLSVSKEAKSSKCEKSWFSMMYSSFLLLLVLSHLSFHLFRTDFGVDNIDRGHEG